MALVELKTDLKSLKNSTFGAKALLVGKDINDPPKSKGLMMQVTRRADDLVRHTKLLGRREGLKFIGNQALLAQTNLKQKIKQGKKDNNLKEVMKNQLIQTGINTVAGTASILAQIPVNGTGTHLIRGFGGISYLTPSVEPSNINGFIARISKNLAGGTGNTVNAAVNSLNGELTILDTPATSQHKETEGTEKSKFINDKGEISRATPYGAEDTTENNYINSHVKYKNGGASVDLGSLPSALPAEEERVNSQDADQGGGAKKIPLRKRIDSTDGQSMFGETVSTSNRVVRTSSIRNENYETYKITGSQEINSVSSSISDKQEDSKRQERTSIISSQESLEKAQNYDLYKTTGSQEINSVSSSISEKLENSERQERTSIISSQENLENAQNYDVYKVDGEALGTMQNPIILHNPGKTRLGADGTVTDEADRPDAIQNLGIETSALGAAQEDLIPFEFNTFTPGNVGGKFLYFRALLDGFADNYSGDWAGTKYVGRGEELYTYNGFKRDISFDFKAAAFSKADMAPLYEKLNALVGSTAPTYGDGLFMQGTFTKITVGDYLKKVPGIIKSVGLTWDKGTPWEIEGDLRVPHMLSVSIAFTPIHNFVPQEGSRFIG